MIAVPLQLRPLSLAMLLATAALFATPDSASAQSPRGGELLELSLEALMEVTVTSATRDEQPLARVPASVMVISRTQILERGYQSLDDLVRDLPGIDLVDVQGTFPLIWSPRGAYGDENKRTLLLIDGVVENNLLEGNVLGGPQYSLHNIERVEVLWGPASSLYGANAFSAVINLITRSGRSIGGTEISLGRGQDQTRFEKLLWGGEANGLEYALSASRYSTDGPRFRERHPNYSASYVDNATSLWARLSWRGWRLSAYRYDRPMGYGQFANPANAFFGLPLFGWEQSEGQAVNNSLSPVLIDGREGTRWRSVTQSAVLGYTRQIGNNLDVETRLYQRRTGIDDDSYQYAFFLDREFAYVPFTHDSTLNGIDLQANYAIAPGRALILGLSAEDSDVEKGYRGRRVVQEAPRVSTNIDERVGIDYRNRSVFAQYRHDSALLGGTRYTLGVRADRNRVYGDTVVPRLGIVSTPFSRVTLKAMYGEAYRAPNAFDSFAETDVRIANPDLKPEYLRSLEFTAAWQITPAWRVEAGLFHNRITDGIVSNVPIGDLDGDGDIDTQNRNAGEARIAGIELRGYWQARPSLSVFVFADRQQPRQEQQGATYPVPNVARWKGALGVTWRPGDATSLYLMTRAVGDRFTAPSNPRSRVAGYVVTDLAFDTRLLQSAEVFLNISVRNLFDADHADPGIRAATGLAAPTQHTYPGRTGLLSLRMAF